MKYNIGTKWNNNFIILEQQICKKLYYICHFLNRYLYVTYYICIKKTKQIHLLLPGSKARYYKLSKVNNIIYLTRQR